MIRIRCMYLNINIWYVGILLHDIALKLDMYSFVKNLWLFMVLQIHIEECKATYPKLLLYYEFSFFLYKKNSVISSGSKKIDSM
jgi:hypothetical protein